MLKKELPKRRISLTLTNSPIQQKKQNQISGYLRLYYKSLGTEESDESIDLSNESNSSRSLKINDIAKNNISKIKASHDNTMRNKDFSGSFDDRLHMDSINSEANASYHNKSGNIFDTEKMLQVEDGIMTERGNQFNESDFASCENILENVTMMYNSKDNIRGSYDQHFKNRSQIKKSLINQLDETKLEEIFMWIKKMSIVTKDEFVQKICDIINQNLKAKQEKFEIVELVNSVFELVDFQDKGKITKKEFFDFMFEQGFSKNRRSMGTFSFHLRKELRMNSSNVIVYETVGNFGIQEKRSDKFYIIRLQNFAIVGALKMEKSIYVKASIYIPDFDEYIFVLSDKTFGKLDMKDFVLRCNFKLPENVLDIIYSKRLKVQYILAVGGRVSAMDMTKYFDINTKKIESIDQLNYRYFDYPIQNKDDTIFETATAILWIDILKLLLIACKNLSIYVFIVGTNNEMKPKSTLNGHTKLIRKMVYSKTSRYVYSFAYDNTICVWNPLVKKYVNCINVFKDTDQIIKDISVPDNSNVLCGITEKGMCIIWETQNWTKLAVKNFSDKARLYPFEGKPYILCGGYNFSIYEYNQGLTVQKVTIDAAIISFKYNMMYFSIKNKLCSTNLSNYTLENERTFEKFDKIITINLNENNKQLILGAFNGNLLILHSFTFEVLLQSDLKGLNSLRQNFYEDERLILEVYRNKLRFIDFDLSSNHYNICNSLTFDEYSNYKAFDTYLNTFLFGLINGFVVYVIVQPADYSMISFKISDSEVCFVKIIHEDSAIIVGDKQNNNYYINLTAKSEDSSPNSSPRTKREDTTIFDFKIKKIKVVKIKENQNYFTHCTKEYYEEEKPINKYGNIIPEHIYNEDISLDNNYNTGRGTSKSKKSNKTDSSSRKMRIFLMDNKGFLYIITDIACKEITKMNTNLSYFRTHSSEVTQDIINYNRNYELENQLGQAQLMSQNLFYKRISSNNMRFMAVIDEGHLIVITKGKSLKKWNIEKDILKEEPEKEFDTDIRNKKYRQRTLLPKDYNHGSSKKTNLTKGSSKNSGTNIIEKSIQKSEKTIEEVITRMPKTPIKKINNAMFVPWIKHSTANVILNAANIDPVEFRKKQALDEKKRKEEEAKAEIEFMSTFESGQVNDRRKSFYFKKKFKEIPGLLGTNTNEAETEDNKKDELVIKNYTKRQQDKLGDDMKDLIDKLDDIEQLMPERDSHNYKNNSKNNKRGDSKNKFQIRSGSKNKAYGKRL